MTGADSPVIADSSTEAMPSTTSPSLGMKSPVSTSTTSPGRRSGASTSSNRPFRSKRPVESSSSRLPCVSVRARRRVAACALPRPSAIASAKLANSTVNQSQILIWMAKPGCGAPARRSRTRRIVVRVETISTTNITGLRHIKRGSSLRTLSTIAGRISWRWMIPVRRAPCARETGAACKSIDGCLSVEGVAQHREVLDDRAERQRGEEG
jgi:hypothetical protein